ncbi:phosphotransferase [Sphaerisporangium krabiense]|uniref:Aminoglycoside phosphotransferase (APT) family kinase protein n=1 Tax=Sphaerisporangium krabiense TaxID=763782 RepID=A0A7W9DT21_9ACTN|nr:aminoglycoside phosphotransferase family protein [Sphaerisporangium krabiense]MBB5629724.1 aminoglycoside phosphotransferase (APT) family kinase protein [Sphaerisporangium krabiense]GII63824.1 phosphotransferase [Sphaerisporangium krabiense]
MESRTKRRLTPAQLDALAARALGAEVGSAEELLDGFANAVWRLTLKDGRQVVLKAGPPPGLEALRYERDLLRTEALVYHLATPTGLPLPRLLQSGFDDPELGGDYLIMSALDGVPWNQASSLGEADQRSLRHQLGGHIATLHGIPGDGVYGYPYAALTGTNWRDAFLAMTGALLDDAVRYATPLPRTLVEIAGAVYSNAAALEEVTAPALVHFDLWPGNVFLTPPSEGPPRIQALIDYERAFWGDPLADFVAPTIFGELDDDDPVLAGYREAGGKVELTPGARTREAMYRVYLYLVLLVENGPRQYPEESYGRIRGLATEGLTRSLDVLTRR